MQDRIHFGVVNGPVPLFRDTLCWTEQARRYMVGPNSIVAPDFRVAMDALRQEPIAIACDHAGVELKEILAGDLRAAGYAVLDLGTNGLDSVDYPDFADKLAQAIKAGEAKRGVLICGTGIGISIAANRHRHIRAAVVHNTTAARLARQHNDANVVAIGARVTGSEVARDCLKTFLETEFEGGRHQRRIDKLTVS